MKELSTSSEVKTNSKNNSKQYSNQDKDGDSKSEASSRERCETENVILTSGASNCSSEIEKSLNKNNHRLQRGGHNNLNLNNLKKTKNKKTKMQRKRKYLKHVIKVIVEEIGNC